MKTFLSLFPVLSWPLMWTEPLCATPPCSPDTWFANKNRSSAEWMEMAKWVAVGRVTARKEIIEPYANCQMEDRSKCAMEGRSIITVKIIRWESAGTSFATF